MAWKTSKLADLDGGPSGRTGDIYESSTEGPMRISFTTSTNPSTDSKLQRCLGNPENESNWSDVFDLEITGAPVGAFTATYEISKSNMGPFLRLKIFNIGKTVVQLSDIRFSEFIKE